MQIFLNFGYLGLFLVVGIESIGIPLPGETALLTAAIVAGTTHRFNIYFVIFAAIFGAIVGDNIGYWIGRELGKRFLLRYGKKVRLDEKKLKLGQYLFNKYGGRIVFFGRFFALLRILAAYLAGANNMKWERFIIYNASGAIAWSSMYGFAGYTFGKDIHKFDLPVKITTIGIGILILVIITYLVHKNEKLLEREAEKALPGPLKQY